MSLRTFRSLSVGAMVGLSGSLAGCTSAAPPDGQPNTQQVEDTFFSGTQYPTQNLAAGGQLDLTGGGRIRVPRSSPGGAEVSVADGALKADANQRFQEWNDGVSLTGPVHKISVGPNGQAPDYLIVELPASNPSARIYVAGEYMDAETEDLSWTAVPGSYDPQTGMVTAAVGLGLLEPIEQTSGAGQKSGAPFQGGPLTYSGYVGVAVGGQQFNAQIVFFAEAPTGSLEVPFEGPPIEVRGRVGASLSNITDQPLESLTVQSRFGPRPAPCAGCSTQHKGVDYVAANGTTVYAAGDGVVTAVQWQDANNHGAGAGFYVKIDHGNGEETKYFHLQDPGQGLIGPPAPGCTNLGVCVGDMVSGGQPLADSDSTGNLTGPHLHFETWKNGAPVDPTLIYDQVVTGTMAMAIDYDMQAGTEQQFLLTRGVITPADMTPYSKMVPLTGVEPGEHRLQFVIVEPSGTLEILATVPLIVGEPFLGLTGAELFFVDTTRDDGGGSFQYITERFESVFSLVAIDDSRLQGEAHITYFRLIEDVRGYTDFCPTSTDTYGPVEWDAFLEGTYGFLSDGSIAVGFTATPPNSPDYTYMSTHPGCPQFDTSSIEPGIVWSHGGWNLVDGRYDYHEEDDLQPGVSGEDYYEIHLRWTVP
jgi:murein DD-endopeptidase MepM/ murein hydrolase activator NlpD